VRTFIAGENSSSSVAAYERMLKGDVRYRFVIDIASLK
jgi:D-arabinose 1-dehydrogenase-like Zn-dependent alcohol dehydrogenase